MKPLYTAKVTATGGRDGQAKSSDGNLEVKLATPEALGGKGGSATNPEQLFAAGYSGCFLSALQLAASKHKIDFPKDASVEAQVGIGKHEESFALAVDLYIRLPGVDAKDAKAIADKAHELCPYSKATRGNVEVTLHVS